MVTMNALQLYLLELVPADWADYRTEYNIIAANCSTVVNVANDQVYTAQAIHLTPVQDVDVTLHVLSGFRSMLQ